VPDPSSQATCTIGGNIAENAGGIHCLKYGMTVDHVLGARVVLSDGAIVDLTSEDRNGYDLLGVFVGSEGTFGICTEATLRLTPLPPSVRTLLADFKSVDEASRSVSAIIAEGLIPSALEMVDGATIRAVEASVFAAGLPIDAEAALLIELDGLAAGLDEEAARCAGICRTFGARNVRQAQDEMERKKLWAARKGAFGAMGRISPDLMLQDAVVPRSRLPEVLAEIYHIGAKYRLRVANVFHAGDGNLHPYICFDSRDKDEVMRVKEAGREMMETCVRAGGTITGEHGVGLDKSEYLPLVFSDDDMEAMRRVRAAFDPLGLCNPGKIIPTSRSCGEARAAQTKLASKTHQANFDVIKDDAQKAPHAASPNSAIARKDSPDMNSSEGALARAPDSPQTHAHVDASSAITAFSSIPHEARNANGLRNALAQIVGEQYVTQLDETHALIVAAAPASVEEACELLRYASSEQLAVIPAGSMSWIDAGNAMSHTDFVITTRRLNRIIEHEPADLISIAEAGVTLNDLNAHLRTAGQWLPLDPPDDGRATVGGVAATGVGGALSHAYQAPRHHIIGMHIALADGRIIKAGGRVVKNVAGYDLCKLFVGSYGTLGLILDLTFKLKPVPASEATIVSQGCFAQILRAARSILHAQLLPSAVEIASLNHLTSPENELANVAREERSACLLLIKFAGAGQTIEYQLRRAQEILNRENANGSLNIATDDERMWREIAAARPTMNMDDASSKGESRTRREHTNQLIWCAQVPPAALEEFINYAQAFGRDVFHRSSFWHAGAGDGRLRVAVPLALINEERAIEALRNLRARARAIGGSLIIERAPLSIKDNCDAWGTSADVLSLMKKVKAQLDPDNILSPNRFAFA
jgi:glycolate oxidase subunit GlcD